MSDHGLKNAFPAPTPSENELDVFFDAVTKGNLSATRAFLDKHPSCVNQPIINSAVPLMRAAYYQQLEVARILLVKGADPNIGDLSDWTALIYAARNGQLEMIDLLLEHGAAIDRKVESSGLTALMFAALMGQDEAVSLLLEKGADAGVKSIAGETALGFAKREGYPQAVVLLKEWQQRKERALADTRAQASAAARLEKLKTRRPKQSPLKKKI
ncbi:MAG: ankyrin repeat domain-containing protein [Alphaproteobacteria bacterium]|nr:ankyrin repeat domain-containing protein [Alphaproteobacteria bacterium]